VRELRKGLIIIPPHPAHARHRHDRERKLAELDRDGYRPRVDGRVVRDVGEDEEPAAPRRDGGTDAGKRAEEEEEERREDGAAAGDERLGLARGLLEVRELGLRRLRELDEELVDLALDACGRGGSDGRAAALDASRTARVLRARARFFGGSGVVAGRRCALSMSMV